MRTILIPMAVAVASSSLSSTPVSAKGSLKGAAIGWVAGHFAGHHGLLGAGAGCVIGHHEANKIERERDRAYHDGSGDRDGYGSGAPSYDRGYAPLWPPAVGNWVVVS
jgi:hypothetical protein